MFSSLSKLWLLWVFSLCIFVGPLCGQGIEVRVQGAENSIHYGQKFHLEVVRYWRASTTPDEWRDSDLGLDSAHTTDVNSTEQDGVIAETRLIECYAFASPELSILPLTMKVADQTGAIVASVKGEGLVIPVKSVLPPDDDGVMELPREMFPITPANRNVLIVFLSLFFAGFGFFLVLRNRKYESPKSKLEVAKERLIDLKRGEHDDSTFCIGITSLIRELRLADETLDEGPVGQEWIQKTCELVKFAGEPLVLEQKATMLDEVEALIQANELESSTKVSSDKGGEL